MTTTPDPIAAIERALEGVTPGPWKVFDGCSWRRIGTTGRNGHDCAVLAPTKASDGHPDLTCAPGNDLYANLNYIAACNPVAITALLSLARHSAEKDAEIARLRAMLERRAPAEQSKSWLPVRSSGTIEIMAAGSALEAGPRPHGELRCKMNE